MLAISSTEPKSKTCIRPEGLKSATTRSSPGKKSISTATVVAANHVSANHTKDEQEYRLVYTDEKAECEAMAFSIDLDSIQRITLNPWMPKPLVEAVKKTIHSIDGCDGIDVIQTTLLENEQWKRTAAG